MGPQDIDNPIAESDMRCQSNSEKTGIYSCGYCGSPCADDGSAYGGFIPEDYDPNNYTNIHGLCCLQEQNQMCVTRDMAIDAGDPDLEGTLI